MHGAEFGQLLENPDLQARGRVLISTLQAILDGSRDPDIADNSELYYRDEVEVRLLLEPLAGGAVSTDVPKPSGQDLTP